MKIETTRSTGGAVDEHRALGKQTNATPLPNAVHLFDASSPVPNQRAVEIVSVAWARRRLAATISLDVMTSGSIFEYGGLWRVEPPDLQSIAPWTDFYSNIGFMDKFRVRLLAPFALVPDAGSMIAKERMRVIANLVQLLDAAAEAPADRVRSLQEAVTIVDLMQNPVPFGLLYENVPFGKTLGRFVCPACSTPSPDCSLVSIPSHHSVRKTCHGFSITKGQSTGEVKCRGAKAWLANVRPDTNLPDLVKQTGFVLNGMAAFNVIHHALAPNAARIIRDYSDPRGIARFAESTWPDNLWFSTRITVRDANEKDVPWSRFMQVAPHHAAALASCLDEIPFLSNGHSIAITL